MHPWLLVALVAALFVPTFAFASPDAPASDPDQIPCRDTRGCPDITVDPAHFYVGTQQKQFFSPSHCAVQEGLVDSGSRHLVKLSFNTPNQGDGSLIIGRPTDNPDHFTWSDCHRHYHFDDFAHYRVWTVDGYLAWDAVRTAHPEWTASEAFAAHPELVAEMVGGHKQGFCVMDLAPAVPTVHGYAVPPDLLPRYNCSNNGISRGWADIYHFTLDGQWVDVTDVTPGAYILEGESNPERRFAESDYTNNRAMVPVTVLPL